MMECEFLKLEKERGFKKHYEKTPIKIRNSLYGGRTSPAIIYKDCYNGGKIHYVDFVSLYPSIEFFNEFPVGNPSVDVVEERNRQFLEREMKKDKCDRRCGFLKCKIVPPNYLYFPVLPVRIDNKLCFPLCFECACLKENESICNHTTEEKLLFGTWCLHEIYEALDRGYTIHKIYELIYYNKKMKIFEKYVAKFYTLKTQYSGIPKERMNDEENAKKELSEKLMKDFGIYVKPSDIPSGKNEAMRYVMKLILNSLWGKLCQNPNKASVYFVNDYEELMHYIENKEYESVYFDILDCNLARVVCNYKEEHNYKVNKVCVSIGSYITLFTIKIVGIYKQITRKKRVVL